MSYYTKFRNYLEKQRKGNYIPVILW